MPKSPYYEPGLEEPNPNGTDNSLWYRLVHLNPALWRGLVVATVALLASSGVVISDQIPNNLVLFIGAVAAIVQALWTKTGVTPNAKVVSFLPEPIMRPGYIRAGEAVTTATEPAIVRAATQPPTH